MHTLIAHRRPIAAVRGGFTLIEMLVATTLVVLMMLMFAQIYIAAISSLGEQQAVARNDGKARLADLLLRGDLQRGSFRPDRGSTSQGIVPLVRGDNVSQTQKGFVYISENDQTNPVDDVLHFTTFITRGVRNRDPSYYYGRCQPVNGTDGPGGVDGLEYRASGPFDDSQFPNHPELDDGDTSNQVGASRAAEVVYFVRGGNLYRRVLLIRDTDLGGQLQLRSAQPSTTTAPFNRRILAANNINQPSFYKAFDYAARCEVVVFDDDTLDSVQFLGIDALDNREDAPESLGRSMSRFGFAQPAGDQVSGNPIISSRGMPIEYDNAGNFFGRPVHAETGSYRWSWPGERDNPLLNPLSYSPQTNQLSVSGTPMIDPDTLNSRAIEDLLLSNVEAFDIEVWDSGLVEIDNNGDGNVDANEDLNNNGYFDTAEGFVQLGDNNLSTGYFRAAQRLNPHYGPGADPNDNPLLAAANPSRNWVFDTGHPDMWADNPYEQNAFDSARTDALKPPYRPLLYRITEDADGNGVLDNEDANGNNVLDIGEDTNGNGILDIEDLNGNNQLDRPIFPTRVANIWSASTPYASGDVVFKQGDLNFSVAYRCVASGEDQDGDGILDAGEDGSQGPPNSLHTVNTLDLAQSDGLATSPLWPGTPGLRVTETTRLSGNFSEDANSNNVLDSGEDANGNGRLDLFTPSSLTWEAFDNRVPLKKIRITVRVRDPIEGLARQFSIVHSFAVPEN